MKRVLVNDGRSMRLVHLPGEHGVFEFLDYKSADDVRRYLERFSHETGSVVQLRRALAEDSYGLDVPRMTDDEVFEEMSWRVVHHQFGLAEQLPDPPIVIAEPQEASSSSSEPPPLPKSQKKLTDIKFIVKWDDTGKEVARVRLIVKTPDGVENYHDTNSQGLVQVEELDPGICDVRCDIKDLQLKDTLVFVGMGDGGPPIEDNTPRSSPSALRIASVKQHKVKKGDSIKSLATAAGMTWQDLAKFNWGTAVPDEINKHLRDEVGCTVRTRDKKNYQFSDDDNPGIIFIPRKWEQPALATGTTHVIRVAPLMAVFDYSFERDGEVMKLGFSVRGIQPEKIKVRLFECLNQAGPAAREGWIRDAAPKLKDAAGLEKSGRFHTVVSGDTLSQLAAKHGLKDWQEIYNCFMNEFFRKVRQDPNKIEPDDVVYIPQLRRTDGAIALGPVMTAEKLDEAVAGGKRYEAKWDIKKSNYDPLDQHAWMPERQTGIPANSEWTLADTGSKTAILYLPQFAVLAFGNQVIGVSPDPLWLVHNAKFEKPTEAKEFRVFLADGTSREVPKGQTEAEFEGTERPLTLFGATPSRDAIEA